MRISTLVCACALALIGSEALSAFGAAAQNDEAGMGGSPLGPTRSIGPLPATSQDPAERSAKSIECAQKADAQSLQGKPRKHFLHECKSGM
jgi:psiF repeat